MTEGGISAPFIRYPIGTSLLMAGILFVGLVAYPLPPALNVFVIARQNNAWIESASVAVLLGTFASVVTLTTVMWLLQTGRLAFP